MKIATSEQMREMDRKTIEEFGVPGEVLMERAGRGVAAVVRRAAESLGWSDPVVKLFAGKGNNGGDAFAAARCLRESRFRVAVWLAGSILDVRGDALIHLSKMKTAGVDLYELPSPEHREKALLRSGGGEIVVDGLLGTGSKGAPSGIVAETIGLINALAGESVVVAIDVPSGLNADTGEAEGETVCADITATMGLPKAGLVNPAALEHVGSVEVIDIGIPEQITEALESDVRMIAAADLKPMFKRRRRDSHKGTFGHVLLIGGSSDYPGAIAMAGMAALRSGAGLVTVVTPRSVASVAAAASPELIVCGVDETPAGSMSSGFWEKWNRSVNDFSAVLAGPGLTDHEESMFVIQHVIRSCRVPLVLDADALTMLASQTNWLKKVVCPIVITPHPGEMARLLKTTAGEVQADRFGAVRAAAEQFHAVTTLKGGGTLVTARQQPVWVNMTGNPGMATAGMGDVLSGLLTGLIGQGLHPFDAARAAVYAHGRAGDNVALRLSQAGLIATDVIKEIPYVLRELAGR